MSDARIRTYLEINGVMKAQDEIKTLTARIRELHQAMEKLHQSNSKVIGFENGLFTKADLLRKEKELSGQLQSVQKDYYKAQKQQDKDYSKYIRELKKQDETERKQELKSTLAYEKHVNDLKYQQDKAYSKYIRELKKQDETERRQELKSTLAYEKYINGLKVQQAKDSMQQVMRSEQDSQAKRSQASKKYYEEQSSLLQRHNKLTNDVNARIASGTPLNSLSFEKTRKEFNELQNKFSALTGQSLSNPLAGFKGYDEYVNKTSNSLRTFRAEANKLSELRQDAWIRNNVSAFQAYDSQLQALSRQQRNYTESIGQTTTYLGSLQQKLRSHMNWIIAGGIIGGAISLPLSMIDTIKKIEVGMAGMNQVINHKKLAEEAAAKGVDKHKYAQEKLNKEAETFINLAAIYGEKSTDVIEAGKLWGRLYKDLDIVNSLTGQSAKLAVADNFSLIEANKALEAAMFQYGLTAKSSAEAVAYSGRIIDVWTKLAHTAGASAQDLTQAVERTGSVAKMVGVEFEFLNAIIATGVRSTGRSGAEIGNTLKTVFGSIHSADAIKEMAKLGVEVYKFSDDGTREFRKVQDVLVDLMVATQGTEANLENLFKSISGGKFQWAKASAMFGDYKEFIRAWGEAVSATGFTDEQIAMQLDTLSRKIATVKADMTGLVTTAGNAGLTKFLKDNVDILDNMVVGLKKIPQWCFTAAEALAGIAIAISLIKHAMLLVNTQVAIFSRTGIGTIIAVLGLVIGTTAECFGYLENQTRRSQQAMQDEMVIANQQLESMKQRAELSDALFSSYKKLDEQLSEMTKGSDKYKLTLENRKVTEEELTNALGRGAVQRIKQAGWTQEAYDKEREAFQESISAKELSMREYALSRKAELEQERNDLVEKLKMYYKDADTLAETIEKKIKLLTLWERVRYQFSKHESDKMKEQLQTNYAEQQELYRNIQESDGSNPGYKAMTLRYAQLVEQANHLRKSLGDEESFQENLTNNHNSYIDELHDRIAQLEEKLKALDPKINFHPSGSGGHKADETDREKEERLRNEQNKTNQSTPYPTQTVDEFMQPIYDNYAINAETIYGVNGCTAAVKALLADSNFIQSQNLWVPDWVAEAKRQGLWADASEGGKPGDVVVLQTDPKSEDGLDHVVVVGQDGNFIGNSSSLGRMKQGNLDNEYGNQNIQGYIRTGYGTSVGNNHFDTQKFIAYKDKMKQASLFTSSDAAAKKYESTLHKLTTAQEIFGKSADNNNVITELMIKRRKECNDESALYADLAEQESAKVDNLMSKNAGITSVLKAQGTAWKELSREEQRELIDKSKLNQSVQAQLKMHFEVAEKYKKKSAEMLKDRDNLTDEILKANYAGAFDPEKTFEREMAKIEHNNKMKKLAIGGEPWKPTYNEDMRQIELTTALQKRALLEKRLNELYREREVIQQGQPALIAHLESLQAGFTQKAEAAKKELESITEQLEIAKQQLADGRGSGSDITSAQEKVIELTKLWNEKQKEVNDSLGEAQQYKDYVGLEKSGQGGKYAQDNEKSIQNIAEQKSELDNKVNEYHDKFASVREEGASVFSDLVVQGNSFKNVWKKLWQDLANDAIRQLLRLQSNGVLGKLIGIFTGNKMPVTGASSGLSWDSMGGYKSTTGFFNHNGGKITPNPKMHTGGRVMLEPTLKDDEVTRTLQVGERVLSKDDNKRFEALMPKFAGLASKGIDVAPSFNQDVMNQTKVVMNESRQTKAQLSEMQRTNVILTGIVEQMSQQQSGGGNVVVMPVAPDAQSVLKVLQDNPRAVQAILGGQKRMGFR